MAHHSLHGVTSSLIPRFIYESIHHENFLWAPVLQERLVPRNPGIFHPVAQELAGVHPGQGATRPILVESPDNVAGVVMVYVMATASENQLLREGSAGFALTHFAMPVHPTVAQGRCTTLHTEPIWPDEQYIIAVQYCCQNVNSLLWTRNDQTFRVTPASMFRWKWGCRWALLQWYLKMRDPSFRSRVLREAEVRYNHHPRLTQLMG
jgi:hypothetical protein